jgi:site-specific recombinase XerD
VIREFYEYLKTPENPALHIVFKKDTVRKLPRVPSQPVIEGIIGNLAGSDTILRIRDRLMIELAYGSGLRRSEMVKLDIEDINIERKTAYIIGKGGNERIVPLTAKALEALREYLSIRQAYRGALLVSFLGKRLSSGSVYSILRDKAGIRPHLLRHACASHMLKNGCSIRVIQQLLGHKKLSATQIYTQVNKEDLREVINRKHPGNSNSCLKDNELYLK